MAPTIEKKNKNSKIKECFLVDNKFKSMIDFTIKKMFDLNKEIIIKLIIVTNKRKDFGYPSLDEFDKDIHYYTAVTMQLESFVLILNCIKAAHNEDDLSEDWRCEDEIVDEKDERNNRKVTLSLEDNLLSISVQEPRSQVLIYTKINANLIRSILKLEKVITKYYNQQQ